MTIKESVLFTKKKKKVVGTAAKQRQWPPCGDRSDPRPMTSGAEPSGRASFAPAIGTASGAGGKKPKLTPRLRGRRELHFGPGLEKARVPQGAAKLARSPSGGAPRALFPLRPAGGTRTPVHARTRERAHTRPQRAAPHAPARPRRTRLGSAPRAAPTRSGACPGPISARTHICTRRGTPGGGSSTLARAGTRAHADPRALSSPRSAVFFMNENVVCK